MSKLWTLEEELMIKNGMSNEEVAQRTGRTIKAIEQKRYRLTGHCVPPERVWTADEVRRSPASFDTKETRIDRIKALARKLGVKLFGE